MPKNCAKCNERTHDAEDGDEYNAESHEDTYEDEHETAHWANDNDHGTIDTGTGNDFGLTVVHFTTSGSGKLTVVHFTTSWSKHDIQWYPMRQVSYSIDVIDKIKTVPLFHTIIFIIQKMSEHMGVSTTGNRTWDDSPAPLRK